MDKREFINLVDNVSNIIIALTLFLLPILFFPMSTDLFVIPKQVLMIVAGSILLLLIGIKFFRDGKITVNVNPLNLAVGLFAAIVLISSLLSQNRYDSLIQAVPAIFAILFFFIIVNTTRNTKQFSWVLSGYLLGAAVSAIITIFYFFKIFILPVPAIQGQYFNTFGSILQQAIYLLPVLILSAVYVGREVSFPKFKLSSNSKYDVSFFVKILSVVTGAICLVLIAYEIIALPSKPIVLPYIYGFQTAAAVITQSTQNFFQSLLTGSGYGTFLIDFTRFKLPSFNLEQTIWSLNFSFSSSYFLELIATTGLLGAVSFIYLIIAMFKSRITKNPLFIALFVSFVLALVLPFAYTSVALLFVLAGLYVSWLNISNDRRTYDVVLSLVSTKNGMLSFETRMEDESRKKSENPLLPGFILLVIILIVGGVNFYLFSFVKSDFAFADSLRQAQLNNGQKTYELQVSSINTFPYRSDYHRIFSQVNLALANSLAAGIQPGASPSAQVQQSIATLLQQSITSGRNAIVASPLTPANWENLGQIYRSLIGVGQNADQYAIASLNQAIALDPYNPQLHVELGGVYYQLQQWDLAQQQFQTAISLKQDYANAYYNLGHVFEAKGDLQNAIAAYQVVKQLSAGNKANVDKIDAEITALQAKAGGQQGTNQQQTNVTPSTEQTPLEVSTPSAVLPTQKPPIRISPPPAEENNNQ